VMIETSMCRWRKSISVIRYLSLCDMLKLLMQMIINCMLVLLFHSAFFLLFSEYGNTLMTPDQIDNVFMTDVMLSSQYQWRIQKFAIEEGAKDRG